MDKMYYNVFEDIEAHKDCQYICAYSARNLGKSTSAMMGFIEEYWYRGGLSILLRRWETDVKGQQAQDIWTAINGMSFISELTEDKYNCVYVRSRKCYLAKRDEDGNITERDNQHFMTLLAVSQAEHYKGLQFNDEEGGHLVKYICYDEVFPSTESGYLINEDSLVFNILSSCLRHYKVAKIIFLGNTLASAFNSPVFEFMNIDIRDIGLGEERIIEYEDEDGGEPTRIFIHYVDKRDYKQVNNKNNVYFNFKNPKVAQITGKGSDQYATFEGLSDFNGKPMEYGKEDVIFTFYWIYKDNEIFAGDIIRKDSSMFIYTHKTNHYYKPLQEKWLKINDEIILTPYYADPRPNWCSVFSVSNIKPIQVIKGIIKDNRIYHQNGWVNQFWKTMMEDML